MALAKISQSMDARMLARIKQLGRGAVFSPGSFLELGGRNAVDVALHRLTRRGVIRRLARGLYDYPRTHAELGMLAPSLASVTAALAEKGRMRLMPAGAYAANLLRLSDQVPAQITFLTDGPSRHIRIGARDITLRHTTPRNMAAADRKSGLIIQALRHLGRGAITPERLAPVGRLLTPGDRTQLAQDLSLAPMWMRSHLEQLIAGGRA